jgi:hypothetical protein
MSRFDSGLEMTYLRITVGDNSSGTSPGSSPYVLEVWPSHHASPVHNHGSSFIVMKVLHVCPSAPKAVKP